MPGERLMCVWQAVFARDVFPESGVKKATVKSVTEAMRVLPLVTYQEARFEETFTKPKVTISEYLNYVCNVLRSPGAPRNLLVESIEKACWEMVEEAEIYSTKYLNNEYLCKLWQIFNRVSIIDSYTAKGPIAAKEEVSWLMQKIAKSLGKTWTSEASLPEEGMSFKEFLAQLEVTFFASVQTVLLRQCIEDLHGFLVREVMKVGWLQKRTKKQSNWTNWLRRWFVLTPTGLTYYEKENSRVQKGVVILESSTVVETLQDFSSIRKKLKSRFRVSNRPQLDIELSAQNELERQQWITNINACIESAKTGTTPTAKLLKERAEKRKVKQKESMQKTEDALAERQAEAKRGSRMILDEEEPKAPAAAQKQPKMQKKPSVEIPPPVTDDLEEYDNNAVEVQKEKIKAVFFQIDKDGNGRIDREEFSTFIHTLGLKMPMNESNLIFDIVDVDDNGYICFGEFYDYFIKFVMGDTGGSNSEARLRAAFLAADRDGSGAVSFKEFAEFASTQRRDLAMDRLLQAFNQLDVDNSGEISYKEFRSFFTQEADRSSIHALGQLSPSTPSTNQPKIEDMLKGIYDQADANELAKYLRSRWDSFASFRRKGAAGELVMRGGHGMVDDVVPGEYALIDLACFNDLPPIEPKTVKAKVQWNKSSVPGKSGRLIFPEDFNGKIPTEFATNETLAYYGCSLADNSQMKVSLLYRHGIQDFTYENNYLDDYVLSESLVGGAGLERHAFSHLDCPLDDNSGNFVIAKLVDDEIHLTSFRIPKRHTLYVPPFAIHCNDYLKGTWRTMLSDEVEIDHVQLVKRQRQGNIESFEFFRLEFESLNI